MQLNSLWRKENKNKKKEDFFYPQTFIAAKGTCMGNAHFSGVSGPALWSSLIKVCSCARAMYCLFPGGKLFSVSDMSPNLCARQNGESPFAGAAQGQPLLPPVVSAAKNMGSKSSLCGRSPHELLIAFLISSSSVLIYKLWAVCYPSKGEAQNERFQQFALDISQLVL